MQGTSGNTGWKSLPYSHTEDSLKKLPSSVQATKKEAFVSKRGLCSGTSHGLTNMVLPWSSGE
jgi:hypothetical protein